MKKTDNSQVTTAGRQRCLGLRRGVSGEGLGSEVFKEEVIFVSLGLEIWPQDWRLCVSKYVGRVCWRGRREERSRAETKTQGRE